LGPHYASWPNPNSNWPEFAWNDWRNYYPGDEYVDWVGIDLYDFEGQNPRDSIQPFYDEYAARKPIILAETAGHYSGAVNADKERYTRQLFDAMETQFPRIKAFVWLTTTNPRSTGGLRKPPRRWRPTRRVWPIHDT